MDQTQTCGRRSENFRPVEVDQDTWRESRGYHTCSYCGSLHPDEFLKAVVEGHSVTPTDKNYKAYIDVPETLPTELRVVSACNFELEPERVAREGWVRPAGHEEILKRDGWSSGNHNTWIRLQARGAIRNMKFYFQHFSAEQKQEFVRVLNAKSVKLEYPGHFYNLPFFVTK